MTELADYKNLINNFLEAIRAPKREKTNKKAVKEMEQKLAQAFRVQGKVFMKGFGAVKSKWPVTGDNVKVTEADEASQMDFLDELFNESEDAAKPLISKAVDEGAKAAMAQGAADINNIASMKLSFSLKQPRAIKYLKEFGGDKIAKDVSDTTREVIKNLVTRGVEEGWSYDKVAKEIIGRFEEFAEGKPQEHIESRAHGIAVTESGNAYCEGNLSQAHELAGLGLEMEKSSLTAGDDLVEEICLENEGAGWIPLDEAFPSGDDRPLFHPYCRCDLLMRRVGAGG